MTQFHEKTLNKNQKLSLTSLRKNSMFIVYIMQIWKMFKFRHIHMQYYALFSKSIRVHLVSQIWSKKYYLGRAAIYTKIMVKNCVTFQKLCFFFHFFIQSIVFVDDIFHLGSKFQNLKNYLWATPIVAWVLFLTDTLWVTEHSDHAVENVRHILSLSCFYNVNTWIFPKMPRWSIFQMILWITFTSIF